MTLHFVRTSVLLIGLAWASIQAQAREFSVQDEREFQKALTEVKPGDAIVLREGEWLDTELIFNAKGTAEAPITLRAHTAGKTLLTGRSRLRIGGEHLIVTGLHFRDPAADAGDLIEFRKDSRTHARHCRLTQCAITLKDAPVDTKLPDSRWISLYGVSNRVDHCWLAGKNNPGATVVVWLGAKQTDEGEHILEHNHFGPREKLGQNGGETLRIGDSKTSMQSARCIIRENLFTRCNGEAECISNKSCDNVYRDNTFVQVSGSLTLRHGNRCLVEGNHFLGGQASGTGGVRIVGEDHIVRANYFEDLSGDDARAALCIMNGMPDSKLHEYFPVKRAVIQDNILVNCATPLLLGYNENAKATVAPAEIHITHNQISSPGNTIIQTRDTSSLQGIRWDKNIFFGDKLGIPPQPGINWHATEKIKRPKGLFETQIGPEWIETKPSPHTASTS